MGRKYFTIIYFLLISLAGSAEKGAVQDYAAIFPKAYPEATRFLIGNRWVLDSLKQRQVDPQIALSVVFPELLRFNVLQDQMEVSALKTLYIQYGKSYADFSIGRFQMKPSFAEEIEKAWNGFDKKPPSLSKVSFSMEDTKENRVSRVVRLDHVQGQLLYLSLFYLLVDNQYGKNLAKKEQKVLLYSTAYNAGFNKPLTSLLEAVYAKTFYTDLVKTPVTTCYSYADIALFFYMHQGCAKFATSLSVVRSLQLRTSAVSIHRKSPFHAIIFCNLAS